MILSMMMTHPGLPAYLPGKKKPEDKNHAVAFEAGTFLSFTPLLFLRPACICCSLYLLGIRISRTSI